MSGVVGQSLSRKFCGFSVQIVLKTRLNPVVHPYL